MEEIYLSARELGEIITTPVRTIENWAAAGKIQQNEAGKYGLLSAYNHQVESLKVKLAQTKLILEETKQKQVEDSADTRARKLKAEADKEEAIARIKNAEADLVEGKLVDADDVGTAWNSMIISARAKLLAIPTKLALELSGMDSPEEIQGRLTIAIDEALIELSE